MKRSIFSLILCLPVLLWAQTEGTVKYKETVQFKIDMPDMDEEMLAMIPTSQTNEKELRFNGSESLYVDAPAEDEEGGGMNWSHSDGDGNEMRMVIKRPESKYYINQDEGTRVHQQEFMGKMFRVSSDIEGYEWKITGEQKTILDYTCQQATYSDSTRNLSVWFTPQIPVPCGPGSFGSLPGLVLEVDINEGERTIQATEVSLEALSDEAIEVPNKGKEVSQEEFEGIVEEKMKEMGVEQGEGGGSGVRIMIRN